jgi:hypothetical protein
MANFTVPQGDPMHGEKEILEPAYDAEVTRAADEQRAFAQRDEVEDYPGDSGKQAAARVKADAYHGLGGLAKQVVADAERGTTSVESRLEGSSVEAKGEGSPLTSKAGRADTDDERVPASKSGSSSK